MTNSNVATLPPEDLIRQAKFIFRGTVQRLNAATMTAVPITDETTVIKVDEVLQAPETLGDYTGKDITVQLTDVRDIREGQQAVFFTNGWLYGESLAVLEVGHRSLEQEAAMISTLSGQIANINQRQADEALQKRIESSEVVVTGRVSDIRPVAVPTQRRPISEHDPEWTEALINIEVTEKGQPSQQTLTILFPASTDVMWYKAPKFQTGQEGLWILERRQIRELNREAFTAIDPLDFQPLEQRENLRRLIRVSGESDNS